VGNVAYPNMTITYAPARLLPRLPGKYWIAHFYRHNVDGRTRTGRAASDGECNAVSDRVQSPDTALHPWTEFTRPTSLRCISREKSSRSSSAGTSWKRFFKRGCRCCHSSLYVVVLQDERVTDEVKFLGVIFGMSPTHPSCVFKSRWFKPSVF
jgi:hypothetical protein